VYIYIYRYNHLSSLVWCRASLVTVSFSFPGTGGARGPFTVRVHLFPRPHIGPTLFFRPFCFLFFFYLPPYASTPFCYVFFSLFPLFFLFFLFPFSLTEKGEKKQKDKKDKDKKDKDKTATEARENNKTLYQAYQKQIMQNKGRTSADRSTRLLSCLQYPVPRFKSYAKDLCSSDLKFRFDMEWQSHMAFMTLTKTHIRFHDPGLYEPCPEA